MVLYCVYEDVEIDLKIVSLIEVYGIGIIVGDFIEFVSLNEIFSKNNFC